MKKICIMSSGKNDIAEIISNRFKDDVVTLISENSDLDNYDEKYDIVIVWNYKYSIPDEVFKCPSVIKVHPSLLPAFPENSAIKDAYLSGVKVTGVTICRLNQDNTYGRIITQYPVLIDNYTHYDQLEEEIRKLEKELLPPVIKSVLEDKIFDIVDFLNDTSNSTGTNIGCGGCKNCGKCSH